MKVPENLVEAVNRLNPRAILILDTQTIMSNPLLNSYQIEAQGRFLLVFPRIVNNQLMSLSLGAADQRKSYRARRALKAIDQTIERGSLVKGIDMGNGRWVITATAPDSLKHNDMPLEERQILNLLGKTDFALLKLSEACTQDLSDTPTLLITADKNLTRSAKHKGLHVCPLADLRSPEALNGMLIDAPRGGVPDICDTVSALLSHDEERPAKIAMTLEEIRSEGDYLIARGSGRLADGDERYPFRWTFPYQNVGMLWEERVAEERVRFWDSVDGEVMPLENVDFMGEGEKIPGLVRTFVCRMLENADVAGQLHPPKVRVRLGLNYLMAMEWGTVNPDHFADSYSDLCEQHNRHIGTLFDGTTESFGGTYRKAFELREALEAFSDQPELEVLSELAPGLASLLDEALDVWSVGETREEKFTYRPSEWPQEVEEPGETEEEYDEEEASEDDEDELPNLDD